MNKHIAEDIREVFIKQWLDKTNKRVVITHNGCNDGRGTLAVVEYYNKLHNIKKMETRFLNYDDYDINDLMKLCKDAIVYVGDFSFLGEDYNKLEMVSKNFIIVDHHETPYNDVISDYPNTHFDKSKSGAYLTYEFFFKDTQAGSLFNHLDFGVPMAIQYISDRDLYQFKLGIKTKAFQMLLSEVETNDTKKLLEYIETPNKLEKDIVPYIEKVEAYEAKCLSRAKEAIPFTIRGHEFYGLNLTTAVSDTLNAVSKLFNKPSVGYWVKEDSIQFSLRNGSDVELDLSKLAQEFDGGGHRDASGFTLKFKDMDLEEFFINRNIN